VRPKVLSSLLLLFLTAHVLGSQNSSNGQKFSPRIRSFRFTYNFTVKDIPAGAKRSAASGFQCLRPTSIRLCAF